MNYLSVKQAAEKWGMSPRRVQVLCNEGRIDGAKRVGNAWTIPETAAKPDDARKKTGTANVKINSNIMLERVWAMPNKNTFEIKPIHDLIVEELTDGTWIDPFANRNKLAKITNDLNTDYDTDYHLDALEFLRLFDSQSVDGVLYDPPYSPRQVSECYNNVGYNVTWDTTKASFWGNHKREISRIVKVGGKVITFGWNSGGIGYKYGFEIKRILMVPHGGWHNDTICTVEVKTHEGYQERTEETTMALENKKKKADATIMTETDNKLISILNSLPGNYWNFSEDDTREYTHGIHSYPAMMVCPISRNILRIMKELMPVTSLLDPFSGSGTVPVEGMLAGVRYVAGNDINPLALFLTKVKTTPIDISSLQSECAALLSRIDESYLSIEEIINHADDDIANEYKLDLTAKIGWGDKAPEYLNNYCSRHSLEIDLPGFRNIGYWFKPRVILLLQLIKNEILNIQDTHIRDFAFVAFSESIRLVSNRRNGEFKMFRMPPAKVATFNPDVLNEFRQILERNVEKMNAFIEAYTEAGFSSQVSIYSNNTTQLQDITDNFYDLVITSPPYGDSKTTVAYGEYSKLSLQWIGLQDLSDKEISGIDKSLMGGVKYRNGFEFSIPSPSLKQALEKIKDIDLERAGDVYSFYHDLELCIASVSQKTKSGGYQFWVVGNRTVKNQLLHTDTIITEIAPHYGLIPIYTMDREIPNKVMPAENSPSNISGEKGSTMTTEHIVILRKN